MLAFELSEEQLAIQAMAREFAEAEIRPVADKLDRSPQLLRDFPWALVRKGSDVGFRTVALPKEYGGLELDWRTRVVLIDELGYPDIACARIFSQNWNLCNAIADRGTREQKERFLPAFRDDDTFLLADAQFDPEVDAAGELRRTPASGEDAIVATRAGGHYLLNGRKQFVSLAPVAKLLLVDARTDGSTGGAEGCRTFIVPADTPGLSVASLRDKVGLRIDLQGELILDNARVPVENLLGETAPPSAAVLRAARSVELSAHAMALARAALDAATRYATERIQGGKRIIEHQAVALELADMYVVLQAGRSLLWRTAWTLDENRTDQALALACKVFCTDAAVEICHDALELFGGAGVMRELPMQKYFRDSLVLLHMTGTNHLARAEIGAILEGRVERPPR